jgi:hypothetical protein
MNTFFLFIKFTRPEWKISKSEINQDFLKKNSFHSFNEFTVKQSWATQIGSRAKFLQKSNVEGQNIDFYYRFSRLFCEILIFQSLQKGRSKKLKRPQVAHGCCKKFIRIMGMGRGSTIRKAVLNF